MNKLILNDEDIEDSIGDDDINLINIIDKLLNIIYGLILDISVNKYGKVLLVKLIINIIIINI